MSESPPPNTQTNSASNRVYSWAILFKYDVNEEFPFIAVALENYNANNFPVELISGHLGLDDRLKPRQLSKFPDSKICLFAKIEHGKQLFFILIRN